MKSRAMVISVAAAALSVLGLLSALAAGQSLAQDPDGEAGADREIGAAVEHTDAALRPTWLISYDLLIIAPEEFRSALQPLVEHKNATDITTTMITLESVYAGFAGVDEPERIKFAIQHYEQNHGVQYVMLVGDVNRFPVRWQAGQLVDNQTDYVYLPSDYYYADLYDGSGSFNGWDADGDQYYGEIYRNSLNPDGMDYEPDVKVGRVTASDVTQVETYVAKVIRYEHTAHSSDWFRRVLLIQAEFTGDIDAKQNIADDLSGFEAVRLYEGISPADYSGPVSDTVVSTATISPRLNEGVGFASHTSHGSPARWYSNLRGTIYAIPNIRSDLHNADALPVIYSGGCQTAQFFYETVPYCRLTDCATWRYLGEDGTSHAGTGVGTVGTSFYPRPAVTQTHNELGIGEAFLVESDSGAVAYFGSQETGQVGTHRVLDEAFFEAYSLGHHILGDMWEYALERFATVYNLAGISPDGGWGPTCRVHTPSRYILFGDPSLRVGGVTGLVDTLSPSTSDDTDSDWHSESVTVRLTATDRGSPPSGVRFTMYRVDSGAWQQGGRLAIGAPADHSNDGVHTIEYRSVDFVGITETLRSAEVRIDTVRPDTDVLLNGEAPAMTFCSPGSPCPAIGCYNTTVSVALVPTDDASGVASTWYALGGGSSEYSAPFNVYGGALLRWRTLGYWAYDNADNREWPEEVGFCVSNWRAGLMRETARILAALEEIVAMRMRKDFASTLPPIQAVDFERLDPQQGWGVIGIDNDGTDGWGVEWDTTKVLDGDHATRMTVWGFPPPQVTAAPQASPMLIENRSL